ncbi:hypothetical protein HCA60_02860 [Listeria booriae]|nr:hypothetical protein [Listeria booriae]MBC1811430.1 hypothetical protein [Listeria booriae]
MKNLFLLLLIGIMATLVACGNEDSSGAEKEKKTVAQDTETKKAPIESSNEVKESATDEEFVKDGTPLSKAGQYNIDKTYGTKIILKKITSPNLSMDLGSLNLVINDVKIFERKGAPQEELDTVFSNSSIPPSDPYYTIQVRYSLENKGSESLSYNGFEYLVTDQKQQINVLNELQGGNGVHEIQSGALLENEYIICVLKPENVENINKITLKTSTVYDTASYDSVADSQNIDVQFK